MGICCSEGARQDVVDQDTHADKSGNSGKFQAEQTETKEESPNTEVSGVGDTAVITTVFGWDITTGPPDPLGPGQYHSAPYPTTPITVQTCSSTVLPSQSITPACTTSANISDFQDHTDGNCPNWPPAAGNYWFLGGAACAQRGSISFDLNLSEPCNVDFAVNVVMSGWNQPGDPNTGGFSVHVNGNDLWAITVTESWATYSAVLPFKYFQAGSNSITIQGEWHEGVCMNNVTVSSQNIALSAQYQWREIYQGQAFLGTPSSETVTYTIGNTSSTTDTTSFASQFGFDANIPESSLLKQLSGKLSANFTKTSSTSHTVTVSTQTTKSKQHTIECPSGYKSNTAQYWQLCMRYGANSTAILQAVPDEDGGVVEPRQYLEK